MVVFSIALSISTERRRKTPPWRSSPRWVFGLFSSGLRLGGGRLLARSSDGAARHLDPDLFRDLERYRRIRHPRDDAVQTAGGDHPVPRLEVLDEILMLPRLLLLA